MSSHNSISDVAIYRQWQAFFHSSHPSSCSGEDVVLPKALFSSVCLLVLSACSAVGVWYHEECRSKFGLKGLGAIMYQWHDCRFVKPLPDSFNQLSCKLHKGDIWHDKVRFVHEQKPHRTIHTHMLAHTLSLSLSHTHTYPHKHYEPTANHSIMAGMSQSASSSWMN